VNTVLIAGGDGFIGRHLTRALCRAGKHVVEIDDHSTSRPDPSGGAEVLEHDLAAMAIDAVPRADAIVHLASPAAPHLFDRDPFAVIRSNTLGTTLLAEAARRDGARLLYALSSEVYGHGGQGEAFREDRPVTHRLLTGRSVYGAAKRLGEELVLAARKAGTDAASVRLFNVYGPGMDPTMGTYARVVPNFLRAALDGRPLPIEGDGQQVRSFTWIDDIVEGLVRLLALPEALPPAVNLGQDEPVAIGDLADLVEQTLGTNVGRERRHRAADDPDWRRPDLTLLETTIGWRPRTTLRDGLAELARIEADHHQSREAACR
jgi:nucleoside-diphosphate-sugar epimerase